MKKNVAWVLASLLAQQSAYAAPSFLPAFSPEDGEDAPAAPDTEKSYQEYWKEVGFKFVRVERLLTQTNCEESVAKFSGCFAAINSTLAALGSEVMVQPKGRLESLTEKYKVLQDFGGAILIEVLPPDAATIEARAKDKKNFVQIKAEMKQRQRLDVAALTALHKETTASGKSVQFASLAGHVKRTFVAKKPDSESFATAMGINGYLSAAKDPHTYLQPAAFLADDARKSESEFVGVGIFTRFVDGRLFVTSPVEGSPAHLAGIHAKDEIILIDGAPLSPEDQGNTKRIRGEKGTVVVLTVKRAGKTLDIRITRDRIVQENVTSKLLQDRNRKLGYIRLLGFEKKEACADVYIAIQELKKVGAEGIIFDLRGNGGGLVTQATCIAGLFIGRGKPVLDIRSLLPDEYPSEFETSKSVRTTTLPLVMLINSRSASASEVLSGALQDHNRALIMGERSFGKATVQAGFKFNQLSDKSFPLVRESTDRTAPPAAILMMTIARFYLPLNWTNQIIGVKPDIQVFRDPKATEEDQFDTREEDLYINSLTALGPAPKPRRPEYFKQIETCMKHSGLAEKTFDARQNDAIPPDFQVLAAEDALSCMTP